MSFLIAVPTGDRLFGFAAVWSTVALIATAPTHAFRQHDALDIVGFGFGSGLGLATSTLGFAAATRHVMATGMVASGHSVNLLAGGVHCLPVLRGAADGRHGGLSVLFQEFLPEGLVVACSNTQVSQKNVCRDGSQISNRSLLLHDSDEV